jgi:ABC-type branched-subunit amino acid transport system substrate-binding protein
LTGEPIVLTVISERTGPAAALQMGDGAVAAAQEINAAGGIGGRPIEVKLCDTQDDPNQAVSCAGDAADGSTMALVATQTIHEAGVLPITDAAGLANVGSFPITPAGYGSPNSFPLSGGGPFSLIGSIKAMQRSGAHITSLVVPDYGAAADALVGLLRNILGDAVGPTVKVPALTPDLTPYVAAATDGADAVVGSMADDDLIRFVRTFRESGSDIPLGLLNMDPERIAKELGNAGEGAIITTFYKPVALKDDPDVKRFVAAMEAAKVPIRSSAELGYASVYLFVDAANRVLAGGGTLDRASILQMLGTITDFDIGLFAPVDFTSPQTTIPGLRLFNTSVFGSVFKGGEVVTDPTFFDVAG